MKILFALIFSVLALAACAHPPGITSWGYDGYTLSVPIASDTGIAGPKKLAMMDAESYCRRQNSQMVFISAEVLPSAQPGQKTLDVVFRCPSKRFPGY